MLAGLGHRGAGSQAAPSFSPNETPRIIGAFVVLLQAVATVRVSIVLAGHFCILRDQGYQRILLPMSQLPETLQQFAFMQ